MRTTLFKAEGIEVYVEDGKVIEADGTGYFEYDDTDENRAMCIEDAKQTVIRWEEEKNV